MNSELKNRWTVIENLWDQINIYDGPDVFFASYSAVGQPAGLLYAATFAESEICNGGFKQHFSNSTGILSPEAVQGFQFIGMHNTAQILLTAMETLGHPFPRERKIRQEILKNVPLQTLKDLDERFFQLIETENGGFEAASDAIVINLNDGAK
jgi:Domain of unknown function (DUF4375)